MVKSWKEFWGQKIANCRSEKKNEQLKFWIDFELVSVLLCEAKKILFFDFDGVSNDPLLPNVLLKVIGSEMFIYNKQLNLNQINVKFNFFQGKYYIEKISGNLLEYIFELFELNIFLAEMQPCKSGSSFSPLTSSC